MMGILSDLNDLAGRWERAAALTQQEIKESINEYEAHGLETALKCYESHARAVRAVMVDHVGEVEW